jgi:hypothetical protein
LFHDRAGIVEARVSDTGGLFCDRANYPRIPVTQCGTPHTGLEVDVSSPRGVVEVAVLGSDDVRKKQLVTGIPNET